jgi:prepilin-type N-terminal cleavage/methylation domain-containing protein
MKRKKYQLRPLSLNLEAGFTMIELAIASLILAIVISGILLTYRSATEAYRKVAVRLELYQNAYAALGTIARELRGTYRELDGNKNTVTFNTTFQAEETKGLKQEKYFLDDQGLHRQVGDQDALLAPWVEDLEFNYNDGASWNGIWEMPPDGKLPAAVRVKISLKSPPGKYQQEATFESTVPIMAGRK